ncbi:MAG: MAPEG family protein [Myxococcota bacterium]
MYSPVAYVLAAWLLIYVPIPVAGFFRAKLDGGYDNRHPRAQQAQLSGVAARAIGAHNNTLEAFPAFAAAAILCAWRGVDGGAADALSIGFLAARVVYVGFYLGNLATLRSLTWFAAAGCTLGLFLQAV